MIVKIAQRKAFRIVLTDKKEAKKIKYKLKGKFEGKKGESLLVGEDLAYIGIEEPGDEYLGYREIGFYTAKLIKQLCLKKVQLDWHLLDVGDINNFLLGLYMGAYRKKTYKSQEDKQEKTEIEVFVQPDFRHMREGKEYIEEYLQECIKEAGILAENVMAARDFVNAPSNLLYPEEFARQMEAFVQDEEDRISCKVLHHEEIREKGMGLLHAVGDSAGNKPCLVVLSYMGNPESEEVLGFVGKGVCMDTGGYCIKPGSSIYDMKGDMGGAAAVLCAIKAIAQSSLPLNVKGIMPLVENRISDAAFVPGDILSSYAGKTVEIMNTDAEGRLILADAVTYAIRDEKVSKLVDIATLTGAVLTMLGQSITGVMSNDEAFYESFDMARDFYGERHLRLPYYKEHEKMIESDFADIKNLGDKYCGTITAGLFMKAFAEDMPWIHMDIAGTSKVDSPIFAYEEKGATGAGVIQLHSLAKFCSLDFMDLDEDLC